MATYYPGSAGPPDRQYPSFLAGMSGFLEGQQSRGKPLLPAHALSQYVQDCLDFLARVQGIHITGGTKKQFELRVDLHPRNDATRTISFEITRSSEEIRVLQSEICEACRQHPRVDRTGLEPCAFCEQFKILSPLPDSLDRCFSHTTTIHQVIEDRLHLFLTGVHVPPTNGDIYHCEGHVSVPVTLYKFLLHDVDDVTALK